MYILPRTIQKAFLPKKKIWKPLNLTLILIYLMAIKIYYVKIFHSKYEMCKRY